MPGDDAVWSEDRIISPTALKQFNTCPHRVRLRYIDRLEEPRQFNVNLSKGRMTHDFLSLAAKRISQGMAEFDAQWVYDQAVRRLPPQEFPSTEARASHARDVTGWVSWALGRIDRTATILRIEKGERREAPGLPPGAPLKVYARPDLVLLRTLDDGKPLVEFIDYKTGKQRDDDLVPVLMRYVFTGFLKQYLPDTTHARMRFTWYWLEEREATRRDLDLDYSMEKLALARENIARLLAEREWRAQPSHLCHWCPFKDNPCTAFANASYDVGVEE